MTRKHWLIIAFTALLGGFSLYLNTDWFTPKTIHISHRIAPDRGFFGRRRPGNNVDSAAAPLFFEFDRKLALTDIRVVTLADFKTNKYPHLLWHLVSNSNSIPTMGFSYGRNEIPGMRPDLNTAADPLVPGEKYRLLLEAGSFKVYHDFEGIPRMP
jgi:hypothetical protein